MQYCASVSSKGHFTLRQSGNVSIVIHNYDLLSFIMSFIMFTKLMKFRRHPNRVVSTLGGHLWSVILWHSSWIVAIAKNEKVAPVTSLLYI